MPVVSSIIAFSHLLSSSDFISNGKTFLTSDETYGFLEPFRPGLKRVDNYIKAYKAYLARLELPGFSSEDIEVLHLDKEIKNAKRKNFTLSALSNVKSPTRKHSIVTWSSFASGKVSTANIAKR